MGWCTTLDPDRFAAAAGGYLRSRAAENTLLLSAAQDARAGRAGGPGWGARVAGQPAEATGPGLLFGWWEPPDGGEPRGAFVHNPAAPLLISGKAPEIGAALAATLAKMGRHVTGVDAPTEVADAFAAAWSQRAGTTVRAHRNCRVYRLTEAHQGTPPLGTPDSSRGPVPGAGNGAWPPPSAGQAPATAGRLRTATADDLALLAGWLTAFATESNERLGSPSDLAAHLIGYGGAVFWEVPQKPSRFRDAAHHLPLPYHRDPAPHGDNHCQPVALATLTRPVAGTVRIGIVYVPPDRRRGGYATAMTLAVSRAVLASTGSASTVSASTVSATTGGAARLLGAASGHVSVVVMITDKSRSDRWGGRLGFQLVGERAVLRFGPVTGPIPRPHSSGAMPRLPTGPLPRLPRLRR
jgi:hypothetical protein